MHDPTTPPSARISIARRGVLGTGLAASAAAATTLVADPAMAGPRTSTTDPASRTVVLVGANPGFQLFDGDQVTAYVSAWRVDWSPLGAGTAVIRWEDDEVHVSRAAPRPGTRRPRLFTRLPHAGTDRHRRLARGGGSAHRWRTRPDRLGRLHPH